ncbi:hypothetical protein ACNO8X_16430 [Mycobacterium sp. PDNC021]|uniref:hypothetical protein n=1 Tax=Mycobacterium sp. PDNC021 TaxID=3391399 RepID=UPI003AAF60C4
MGRKALHRSRRRRQEQLPVWLVSSGPLDDSAERQDIPPTRQVAKLAGRIGALGHVTFGGRLARDVKGFPASTMAKKNAGDWWSRAHIQRWVEIVVNQLNSPKAERQSTHHGE